MINALPRAACKKCGSKRFRFSTAINLIIEQRDDFDEECGNIADVVEGYFPFDYEDEESKIYFVFCDNCNNQMEPSESSIYMAFIVGDSIKIDKDSRGFVINDDAIPVASVGSDEYEAWKKKYDQTPEFAGNKEPA